MKIAVYATAAASVYIGEVDIASSDEYEDAAEKLWKSKGYDTPTLCHQCAGIDIGDFEIDSSHVARSFK